MSRCAHSVRQMVVPFREPGATRATVISVTDAINAGLFSTLDAEFRRVPVGQPVIINLSGLTLGNVRELDQLVLFLGSLSGSRVSLVCGRLSARRLLRFAGAADIVPVFMTTADAVQALLLHDQGYGSGWSMTSATTGAEAAPSRGGEAPVPAGAEAPRPAKATATAG